MRKVKRFLGKKPLKVRAACADDISMATTPTAEQKAAAVAEFRARMAEIFATGVDK